MILKGKKQNQYVFETLTPARLEEASEMMSRSFIKINSIWVKLEVKYEEAFKYNLYRLRKGMESEVTFIYIDKKTDKIVGVYIAYDLYDYMNEVRHNSHVPKALQRLKKYSSLAEDEYLERYKHAKKGENTYGQAGCIHPSLARNGEAFTFFIMCTIYMKVLGYKGQVGRTTNKIMSKIFMGVGGTHISTVRVNEEDVPSLNNEEIDFIDLRFSNFTIKSMSDLKNFKRG